MNAPARRFRVALSFAGEKRSYVSAIAESLASRLSEAAILYDKYHEAEFARWDLGMLLPELYHDQADLVVVVVCPDYDEKEWCGLEWNAIYDLLKKRRHQDVMFLRFANATARSLFSTVGYVELDNITPEQAATRILQRLALNEELPRDHYGAIASNQTPPECDAPHAALNLIAQVVPPPRCFGRETELDELSKALTGTESASLLVLGPPGIGKTTLTRQVASCKEVVARFGVRCWFVELETVNNASELCNAIILRMGFAPGTKFEYILNWVSRAASLLVLDNLETPTEQDEPAVQDVLQRLSTTPNVSLLCSSRSGVALAVPRWSKPLVALQPLPNSEARRLFLELARGLLDNDPHLDYFLAELGGVPLAIELVAQRAAGNESLWELRKLWERLGTKLARHPYLSPNRRNSVARSLYFSWRSTRLHREGRVLFRLLGQLPAGIADEDRQGLLGDAAVEAARQLLTVGLAFRNKNRLDLLPPIRDYARRIRRPPGGAVKWVDHYLELADNFGDLVGKRGGRSAANRLMPEIANIEAALLAAAESGDRSRAVQAAFHFAEFCRFGGRGGAVLSSLATACANAQDPDGEALCRECEADISRTRFDFGTATALYAQASATYRKSYAHGRQAWCCLCMGDMALIRSNNGSAQEDYEQALALYRHAEDKLGEANAQLRLGDSALARSKHDLAEKYYVDAASIYRGLRATLGEANCTKGLADVAFDRGALDAASQGYGQALPLFQDVWDVLGEANCLLGNAEVILRRQEYHRALAEFNRAFDLFDQIGAVLGEANALTGLGDAARALGDEVTARKRYKQALALETTVGNTDNAAITEACLSALESHSQILHARRRKLSISTCHCACADAPL